MRQAKIVAILVLFPMLLLAGWNTALFLPYRSSPDDARLVWDQGNNLYYYPADDGDVNEFWRFNFSLNGWYDPTPMPPGNPVIKPGDGFCMVYTTHVNGADIFAFKGNGTKQFYRYNISSGSWTQLQDIPGNYYMEEGSAGCFAGTVYEGYDSYALIYVCKGGGRQGFYLYKYDVTPRGGRGSVWIDTLASLVFERGSALAWGYNSNTSQYGVYAFRGGDTDSIYFFSPSANTWTPLKQTPNTVNQGACMAVRKFGGVNPSTSDTSIWCVRGDNEDDFWLYRIGANEFVAKPALPHNARYGTSIAARADTVYAIIYSEDSVYKYVETWDDDDGRQTSEQVPTARLRVTTVQSGGAVRFDVALVERSAVSLTLHDATGRVVAKPVHNVTLEPGTHRCNWNPERRASGVFFYRLTAGEKTVTGKVALARQVEP